MHAMAETSLGFWAFIWLNIKRYALALVIPLGFFVGAVLALALSH